MVIMTRPPKGKAAKEPGSLQWPLTKFRSNGASTSAEMSEGRKSRVLSGPGLSGSWAEVGPPSGPGSAADHPCHVYPPITQ